MSVEIEFKPRKRSSSYVLASALGIASILVMGGSPQQGQHKFADPHPGKLDPGPTSAISSASSVAGQVRFEGQSPALARINMATDPSCAKRHSGAVVNEDFVIGKNGALANVVVFVSDGLGGRSFDIPAEAAVVQQEGCVYKPHVLALRASQKIKIVNSDNTLHNIHPVPANNREWNKAEPPGTALEETFAREEIAIPVKCNVHPWMLSYIAVFKHPFFAVTGADGSFDLHNLPPGEYTVKAWHEKLGTVTQKIVVTSTETKKIDFVFKR
jgi:plastocyanin